MDGRLPTRINGAAAPAAICKEPSTLIPPTMVKSVKDTPAIPLHSNSGRPVKYCGVCGDIAKSHHFGGLCCDSCKAFFRRSVHNDNYLHFQCSRRDQCVITLSSRKGCQSCRMKRCFLIGMEKSWVMTEEERRLMMKARAKKKLSKQLMASSRVMEDNDSSKDHCVSDYEPQVNRMTDFLDPEEIKEIESIVTKYLFAYQNVPYRAELRLFDNDRPKGQVIEILETLIRRFFFFAHLVADFSSLPRQDQNNLLKGGVLEMCVLRSALIYDPLNNCWPNTNMSMYKDAPFLKLDDIGYLTSHQVSKMHMEFIKCIQQMGLDEPTIMLLVLTVLFTPERDGLIRVEFVEKCQTYYTSLLERYMSWRFGTNRSIFMFGKLLTKLSDLRELSDTHNRQNVRLGSAEISSIISLARLSETSIQFQNLKVNPHNLHLECNMAGYLSIQANSSLKHLLPLIVIQPTPSLNLVSLCNSTPNL